MKILVVFSSWNCIQFNEPVFAEVNVVFNVWRHKIICSDIWTPKNVVIWIENQQEDAQHQIYTTVLSHKDEKKMCPQQFYVSTSVGL